MRKTIFEYLKSIDVYSFIFFTYKMLHQDDSHFPYFYLNIKFHYFVIAKLKTAFRLISHFKKIYSPTQNENQKRYLL